MQTYPFPRDAPQVFAMYWPWWRKLWVNTFAEYRWDETSGPWRLKGCYVDGTVYVLYCGPR